MNIRSITVTMFLLFFLSLSNANHHGVINTSNSPHVKFRSIDIGDCQWTDGFWADKFNLCENVTVPHMGTLLKGNIGHAYNNLKKAAGLIEGQAEGHWWHDGDFYKWMEASMYVYAVNKDEEILKDLDEIIELITQVQDEDGYISTSVMTKAVERWSKVNHHELYNCGHLITSAVVHYRITGRTNFLNVAIKTADYLHEVFSPKPPDLVHFGFNPSQIMALVELYRSTSNQRYLDLAGIFIDMRGSIPVEDHEPMIVPPTVPYFFVGDQNQMRTPLREETEAVGHAVLGMYLWAGAADVLAETGDQTIASALDRIWHSVVDKKMYVTGGIGQIHHGASGAYDMVHEAFQEDYKMPNLTAYNETCANVAHAMFNYRLLGLKGEAKYADVMELALYNSILSGISTDGTDFFYTNPLRMDDDKPISWDAHSSTREPYPDCFCCPPNLVRTLAKVSGWAYSLSENGLAVNLYGSNELNSELNDGSVIKLKQITNYPWDGSVKIIIQECKTEAFDFQLRIPSWANDATLLVNGMEADVSLVSGSYVTLTREWIPGDVIVLELPMEVVLIEGHPQIEEIRNQVAVKRGPIVYCIESNDLPENTDVLDVYLPEDSSFEVTYDPHYQNGNSILKGDILMRKNHGTGMYRRVENPVWERKRVQFVPYYTWSNRGPSEMTVFLPVVWNQ